MNGERPLRIRVGECDAESQADGPREAALDAKTGRTPFAKIGLHRWKFHGIGQTGDVRFDGTDLMLGAGIDWTMGESWGLRVEYLYLPYDSDVIGNDKMHAFLLGAHRRF